MGNSTVILEAGSEGGSIALIYDGRFYSYLSDETSMLDILPGEFEEKELKRVSVKFSTFGEAIQSMLNRYPIFNLHPLKVHSEYIGQVQSLYNQFKSDNKEHNDFGIDKWDEFLKCQGDFD
jgi:hypothetical protein